MISSPLLNPGVDLSNVEAARNAVNTAGATLARLGSDLLAGNDRNLRGDVFSASASLLSGVALLPAELCPALTGTTAAERLLEAWGVMHRAHWCITGLKSELALTANPVGMRFRPGFTLAVAGLGLTVADALDALDKTIRALRVHVGNVQ
jgi:hypothetical protein